MCMLLNKSLKHHFRLINLTHKTKLKAALIIGEAGDRLVVLNTSVENLTQGNSWA